ncbi:hypothetical protein [Chitinophaga alhagiae]|uniref:hypothetical protein n=1 Tax=Chitinophaga alhagiae TaxID=2203219 RepID=UPI001300668F|nr:hypothetical protein [Chitinophaga alhagiae]
MKTIPMQLLFGTMLVSRTVEAQQKRSFDIATYEMPKRWDKSPASASKELYFSIILQNS